MPELNIKESCKENWILNRLLHIRKVQDYMILLELNREQLPFKVKEWELIQRGMQHDLDKFSSKLANNYLLLEEYKIKIKEGISTNIDIKKASKESHEIHYKNNRHHKINGENLSNLDLCEMACDGLATGEVGGKGAIESLKYYRDENNKNVFGSIREKYDRLYVFLINLIRLLRLKSQQL